MELRTVIAEVIAEGFDRIVDVGAAEGYYAVGMARRLPDSRIVCFESSPYYRHLLRVTSSLNNVQAQIEIHGECTVDTLSAVAREWDRWFMLCDCEGYEDILLDPLRIRALKNATILVETHEFVDRTLVGRLCERFSQSHEMVEIWSSERTENDWTFGENVTSSDRRRALSEMRTETQRWLYMRPLR